jgi:hypothetical protein
MAKKGFLKAAAFTALFVGLAAGVSAQITVSGGFALSMMKMDSEGWDYVYDTEIGYGGNVYLDWLLPVPIPLSLGLEAGFDTASATDDEGWTDSLSAIPLLARVAYHFDFARNLDLYIVGKIGYAFGIWKGDVYDFAMENDDNNKGWSTSIPGGLGFGVDLGVAVYFTRNFGIFAEGGFDRYLVKSEATGKTNLDYDGNEVPWYSDQWTINLPFTRFFTVGISLKF